MSHSSLCVIVVLKKRNKKLDFMSLLLFLDVRPPSTSFKELSRLSPTEGDTERWGEKPSWNKNIDRKSIQERDTETTTKTPEIKKKRKRKIVDRVCYLCNPTTEHLSLNETTTTVSTNRKIALLSAERARRNAAALERLKNSNCICDRRHLTSVSTHSPREEKEPKNASIIEKRVECCVRWPWQDRKAIIKFDTTLLLLRRRHKWK